MLRKLAQSSVRLAPRLETTYVAQRSMTIQGLKGYEERETAAEATFFHKEDEKLLRSLLKKVRAQANDKDVHAAKGAEAKELSELEAIVGDKLTAQQKQALIEWKHAH